MKVKSLLSEAQAEIRTEKMAVAKKRLKEMICEIEAAENVLMELKAQYRELLEEDIFSVEGE